MINVFIIPFHSFYYAIIQPYKLMHGSIPTTSLGSILFATPGVTPGTLKNKLHRFTKRRKYYVLQRQKNTKVRKRLSHCFCFLPAFLWLLTLLSCGFFKYRFYKLGQRSPLTGTCWPVWFNANFRPITPFVTRYFNYPHPRGGSRNF